MVRFLMFGAVLAALSARAEPPAKSGAAKGALPSPTETDPDKYKVILDNERVRVFRYHDEPGAKTRLHHHEAFTLYALGPFKRRLTFADGTTKEREFKAGDVIWMEAQDHVGENTGTTSTDVLIVELKEPGTGSSQTSGWKVTPPKK